MVNAHEVPTVEEAELALQQVEQARKEREVRRFSTCHTLLHAYCTCTVETANSLKLVTCTCTCIFYMYILVTEASSY